MGVSALGRLKNHNVPHLHPNFTMFMPLDRLQLKKYAFSGKFNVWDRVWMVGEDHIPSWSSSKKGSIWEGVQVTRETFFKRNLLS